jgi:hypothetical protein
MLYICLIQAETSEDLFEWKTALEEALAQAPNAALVMGHNGIFRNETTDTYDGAIPNCWSTYAISFFFLLLLITTLFVVNSCLSNYLQGERRGRSSR